jgi:dihydroorotate dehydrogenase electron transfer subunit
MKRKIDDLIILSNLKINDRFFVIEAASKEKLPEILPGQFLQVRVDNAPHTFLRRPLSVHNVDYKRNSISMLVQIAGEGTEKLSGLRQGESINVVYPLGNSFTIPEKGEKVLLTGGGCGMAPLLYLAHKASESGADVTITLGFRNKARVLDYQSFEKLGKVFLATEDGSIGKKGFITDIPAFKETNWDRVYCCGPELMMKSIARECSAREIFCEVSLENLMACGIGACLCCVVDTTKGNVCTCTDGPVFNIKSLLW